MPRKARAKAADPFGERLPNTFRRRYDLLGARFTVDSNRLTALRLADAAFGAARSARSSPPLTTLQISVRVSPHRTLGTARVPPAPQFSAAAGLVVTTIDAANYAVVCPATGSALIAMSRDLLEHPYHARYELLEFAAYMLAKRTLGWVPIHAACVSHRGRGALLIGRSGAGKSTLALLSHVQGLDVQAEDISLIDPQRLQVHALPNYLHVHQDSLRLIPDRTVRARLARSPFITRRGGARKLELSLRQAGRSASGSVRLCALIFLSGETPGKTLWRPLRPKAARRYLAQTQPEARTQPGWTQFMQAASLLPAFRLGREHPPARAINRLLDALQAGSHAVG